MAWTKEQQRESGLKYYYKHQEKIRQYTRRYYQEHKEERREKDAIYRESHGDEIRAKAREKRQENKALCLQAYSNSNIPYCKRCGINDMDILTIDHINGGGGKHRRSLGLGSGFYAYLIRIGYPMGYQVLCFNCNVKKRLCENC